MMTLSKNKVPSVRRIWGYSSVGRALAWHARGHRFDPVYLHHRIKTPHIKQCGVFSYALFIKPNNIVMYAIGYLKAKSNLSASLISIKVAHYSIDKPHP